ncbi:MAG TPA: isochorismate synthase [Solirubrobacteraceae bacterium]|nr:isochorismate synthase [Solirubrobacteraceae bacterium]
MTVSGSAVPVWLDRHVRDRLGRRVQAALRRARRTGTTQLVSVTAPLPRQVDPSAVVCASRAAGEPWFCLEQPDRDAIALAGLGCARSLEAAGAGRFRTLAERWRDTAARAFCDEISDRPAPPGAGLCALGGFAFAPDGGESRIWSGFAPGSLILPEVCLARRGTATWLTVNAEVAADDTAEQVQQRIDARLETLKQTQLPLVDPAPVGAYAVFSPMPPSHFEEAVRRATERIAAGEFEKVVLAREVDVHAPAPHDPAAVLGLLREAFPSSFVYAVGRGDATFIGATPELLVRRQGQRASTVALAGSTRRSADPAVDDHLGEQLLRSEKERDENAIVARRIARTLAPVAVWVTAAEEPVVIKVANIQHLAAPIRAQLTDPIDAVTLTGLLHPTPAVGAEPTQALAAIPALEGFDRGWYAGPIGWVDAAGDGEFCVALRGALLRGTEGRCYAGCGIVRDSDPASELAETEIKLGVMLPALAG